MPLWYRKKLLNTTGDFRSHPIGTGPFNLNYGKKIKLVLRKNPLYYERDEKKSLTLP
jgi:ABC-type transport system substrate-binding protein